MGKCVASTRWRFELDAPPAVPALPEEFTLEGFRMEDARPFYETLDAAFQDHWSTTASRSSAGGRRSRPRTISIRRSGSSSVTAMPWLR